MENRQCTKCAETRPVSEFYRDSKARDGLMAQCKACRKAVSAAWYAQNRERSKDYNRSWREANPEKHRENSRKSSKARHDAMTPSERRDRAYRQKFSLSVREYDAMLAAQGGGCAICGGVNASGRSLAVDHDHACCPGKGSCGGCVRALLCHKCNVALGCLDDDQARLESALAYLRAWSS